MRLQSKASLKLAPLQDLTAFVRSETREVVVMMKQKEVMKVRPAELRTATSPLTAL